MNKTTVKITDNNFNELLAANDTVVVDFWAEWCGPCRVIGPVIDELSETYVDKAIIGKLNVDENKETAASFGIFSIPTILFFKGGKLADRVKGAVPKSVLEAKLKEVLAK
jgi:thioredoxin 1